MGSRRRSRSWQPAHEAASHDGKMAALDIGGCQADSHIRLVCVGSFQDDHNRAIRQGLHHVRAESKRHPRFRQEELGYGGRDFPN